MRFNFQTILLACGLLAAPLVCANEEWTLETALATFPNAKAGENCVCILHDGWQIAFLSHNGKNIGAAIIIEQKHAEGHVHDLAATVARIAKLARMETPESMDFEDGDYPCSLLVDQEVLSNLTDGAEHTFSSSPLAGMAYLLNEEYFNIHGIRRNGFLHWKTIKKSGVDLLMPMAENKLSAIEVTGRQEMNNFAADVLAGKLGLARNNTPEYIREQRSQELLCDAVPYMNTKNHVMLAVKDRRRIIGKRQAVNKLLANRNEGALPFPDQTSPWPEIQEPKKEAVPEPEPIPAAPKPPPLTPEAALKAYIRKIESL